MMPDIYQKRGASREFIISPAATLFMAP